MVLNVKVIYYICDMEKVLYIVRGLPSSGKSTLAKQLTSNVFEADHYFYDNDGNYNFIPSEIKEAHKECQQFVGLAMMSSIPKIAVSNTFTQEWEMQPYFDLAKEYGYMVFCVIVEKRHNNKNNHNVPEDKIQMMKDRFEINL
jgi:predicted kinase